MPTALADPPDATAEQRPPDGAGAPAPGDAPAPPRACANCGAALADGQDWCLNCGAGAPGSLGSSAPTWRSAAVVLTALAVLVLGAAGAAYAALSKGSSTPAPASTTVAQVSPPAATAPTTSAPTTTTPPPAIGTPTTIKPVIPLPKAAKIPITPSVTSTPTPKATAPTPTTPGGEAGGATTPATTTPKRSEEVVGEAHPEALLLDTNAASTYNPYDYPAGNFGDPSLAIDGDPTTGWTALVEPSVAPKLAEGLAIDLNTARKLSAVALTTSTPGMTVQVYGSNAPALPSSITDSTWVALTPSFVEHKRHVRIKLGSGSGPFALAAKKPYRFITLWISQAPASAVGTPQAPGHVSVNELELFPAK